MSFKGFDDSGSVCDSSEFEPKTSRKVQKEKLLKTAVNRKVDSVLGIPPEARLMPQESPARVKLTIDDSGHCQVIPSNQEISTTTNSTKEADKPVCEPVSKTSTPNQAVPTSVTMDTPPPEVRLSKLEEFQSKQKLIEEQNRKRREMLTEAINSRKQQTDKETRKLELVQQELSKIDVMLTSDVKFLRNSIEQASLEFMEAQKRYDRAEKEFVEAKLHLFSSLERKELLTDHLCTIIEQNELRKAKKLEELMHELSLDSKVESK